MAARKVYLLLELYISKLHADNANSRCVPCLHLILVIKPNNALSRPKSANHNQNAFELIADTVMTYPRTLTHAHACCHLCNCSFFFYSAKFTWMIILFDTAIIMHTIYTHTHTHTHTQKHKHSDVDHAWLQSISHSHADTPHHSCLTPLNIACMRMWK